jgi:DNA invertase Pin-like site-specific DNA recombinase
MSARAARRFVAYYRVSTDRQGRSGLGLEAQQKAVRDYLDGGLGRSSQSSSRSRASPRQQADDPHPSGRCRARAGSHFGATKAALAAAKARGTKLGTPDPAGAVKRMRAAHMANAARFAANVLPIIHEIQAAGHTSCNAIAGQLNTRKVATANGGRWTHVQVRQILDRAADRK